MEHYRFNRVLPIPPHITDFAWVAKKMITKLDGRVHDFTVELDYNRDAIPEEWGEHVLGFSNGQLLRDREGVLRTILRQLEDSQ